jgi:hypothetical protein
VTIYSAKRAKAGVQAASILPHGIFAQDYSPIISSSA